MEGWIAEFKFASEGARGSLAAAMPYGAAEASRLMGYVRYWRARNGDDDPSACAYSLAVYNGMGGSGHLFVSDERIAEIRALVAARS
jgi:hypothetical protein